MRFGPRRSSPKEFIDRDPQNIQVPLGDFAPVRRNRRSPVWRRWWRRKGHVFALWVGLGAAVLGAWLGATQPPPPVGLRGDVVQAGGASLLPTGTLRWGGGGSPAYALARSADGSLTGSASGTQGGKHFSGRCVFRDLSEQAKLVEHCTFTIDGTPVSADDTMALDGSNRWLRRYSDGQQLAVGVPDHGAALPVAFPIGR